MKGFLDGKGDYSDISAREMRSTFSEDKLHDPVLIKNFLNHLCETKPEWIEKLCEYDDEIPSLTMVYKIKSLDLLSAGQLACKYLGSVPWVVKIEE